MSESSPETTPSIADVAKESGEESTARQRELVGDEPDTGGVVSSDDAQ
jgi:hypothetical protein